MYICVYTHIVYIYTHTHKITSQKYKEWDLAVTIHFHCLDLGYISISFFQIGFTISKGNIYFEIGIIFCKSNPTFILF